MSDRYKIVLKAFIPYPLAADPERDIFRAPAAAIEVLSWGGALTGYNSEYHGDDHAAYDGATINDYRVRRWLEFDWDGEKMSNASPVSSVVETEKDTNVWHQNVPVTPGSLPVYGQTTLFETISYEALEIGLGGITSPVRTKTRATNFLATDETECFAYKDYFTLTISSGNPGVITARVGGGVLEPVIDAFISGQFHANGMLELWGHTDHFPSYGLSIARFNGGAGGPRELLFEEVIFDAYDPKKSAVGWPGTGRIFAGLSNPFHKFHRTVGWK